MKLDLIHTKFERFQDVMYDELNLHAHSKGSPPIIVVAVITSIGDVLVETLKAPCAAIENLSFTLINLIGFMFSDDYCLRHAVYCMDQCLINVVNTPVALFMATFKLIYQLYHTIKDPENAESVSYLQYQSKNIKDRLLRSPERNFY